MWGFVGAPYGNPAGCQVVFLWGNSRVGGKSADSGALLIHPTLCFFEPFFNMGIHGFLWVYSSAASAHINSQADFKLSKGNPKHDFKSE